MVRSGGLTIALLPIWLGVALLTGAAGLYDTEGAPLAILVAAAGPPLLAVGLLAGSERFRRWVLGLDLRVLVVLHAWRVGGLAFIALWSVGELPGVFALPAGLGDISIAITAPLVAYAFVDEAGRARRPFYWWTALGMLDLVVAVSIGASQGEAIMGSLPMSIVPTFGVASMMTLHVLSIFSARSRSAVGVR